MSVSPLGEDERTVQPMPLPGPRVTVAAWLSVFRLAPASVSTLPPAAEPKVGETLVTVGVDDAAYAKALAAESTVAPWTVTRSCMCTVPLEAVVLAAGAVRHTSLVGVEDWSLDGDDERATPDRSTLRLHVLSRTVPAVLLNLWHA